jgi:hypothetical protein
MAEGASTPPNPGQHRTAIRRVGDALGRPATASSSRGWSPRSSRKVPAYHRVQPGVIDDFQVLSTVSRWLVWRGHTRAICGAVARGTVVVDLVVLVERVDQANQLEESGERPRVIPSRLGDAP